MICLLWIFGSRQSVKKWKNYEQFGAVMKLFHLNVKSPVFYTIYGLWWCLTIYILNGDKWVLIWNWVNNVTKWRPNNTELL